MYKLNHPHRFLSLLLALTLLAALSAVPLAPSALAAGVVTYPQSLVSDIRCCSQETSSSNDRAVNAFDGSSGTLWHTQWSGHNLESGTGHWVSCDMGAVYTVVAARYLPRQDGNNNGKFARVRIDTSMDGVTWVEQATVNPGNTTYSAEQRVVLPEPTQARYIRWCSTSLANPGGSAGYGSAAELNIEIDDVNNRYPAWEYAQTAMDKIKLEPVGSAPFTYPTAAQTSCLDNIRAAALAAEDSYEQTVDKVEAAMAAFYATFQHYTKAMLLTQITAANTARAAAAVGTTDGNVSQSDYAAFTAAIAGAQAIYDSETATGEDIDEAYFVIADAISTFAAAVITATPALTDGKPPAYDLAINIDPEAIRFNNLEWTGDTSVATGLPNQGRQSQVFGLNLEKPRAQAFSYQNLTTAVKGTEDYDMALSNYYMPLTNPNDLDPLTSDWTFSIVPRLTGTLATANNVKDPLNSTQNIVDFYKLTYNAANWPGVAVPSSWQVQGVGADGKPYTGYFSPTYGYDPPYYTNITMPGSMTVKGTRYPVFRTTATGSTTITMPSAPVIADAYNPVGFYRRTFDVPEQWIADKNKINIMFNGVEAAFYLYCNGKEVGYHEDSKTAGEFDLTPFLNADGKDNLLAVKVFRWADCSWMDDQDFIRLGGIFRDVFLTAAPALHIRDFKVETQYDANFDNATLSIRADIANYAKEQNFTGYGLMAQLIDASGVDILKDHTVKLDVDVNANSEIRVTGQTTVLHPKKWFPDDPNLFTLVLTLYDKATGVAVERVPSQFGFSQVTYRTSDNRSDIIRLNGQKVVMFGVNRHDTSPYGGHYISPETYRQDLQIMKRHNINTIRTAHYPDDPYLYYLANKMGIMLCAEANNECHASQSSTLSANNFLAMSTDRATRMIERFKNHPAIIMWSVGNECGQSSAFRNTIIPAMRQTDSSRPVHSQDCGDISGSNLTNNPDVWSAMYSAVSSYEGSCNSANAGSAMLCEYAHAMGNSVGNLKEYTDVFRGQRRSIGGCIWDYVDQAIWTVPASYTWDVWGNGMYLGYGGDWGEGNTDNDFCANGVITADRKPEPEMQEVKKCYQLINFIASETDLRAGVVNVRNEYYAKNLSAFDFKWELTENGKVIGSGTLPTQNIPAPSTHEIFAQLPTTALNIPYLAALPDTLKPGAEYFLTVRACLRADSIIATQGSLADVYGPEASVGYSLCDEQFKLPFSAEDPLSVVKVNAAGFELDDSTNSFDLFGDGFNVSFNKANGLLTDFTAGGERLLTEGPRPMFNRAKTANDGYTSTTGGNWRDLDNNLPRPAFSYSVDPNGRWVKVNITYNFTGVSSGTYFDMFYTIYRNGAIQVDTNMRTTTVTSVFRYGANLIMPAGFEDVTWLTRGPKESMNDRYTGAFIGLYETTVTDNFHSYIRCQDTGTHEGTRWMALTGGEKDMGLLIAATAPPSNVVSHDYQGIFFEANALHFTWRDYNNVRHPTSLSPRAETVLSVSYGARGTGGASCGPATLSQYQLSTGNNLGYSYTLIPFAAGVSNEDLQDLATAYLSPNLINVSGLYDAMAAFEALTESDWAPVLWAEAQAAYDAALALLEDPAAIQEEVESATEILLAALGAFSPPWITPAAGQAPSLVLRKNMIAQIRVDSNLNQQNLTYTSSNPTVVMATPAGVVTGKSIGVAVIQVKDKVTGVIFNFVVNCTN